MTKTVFYFPEDAEVFKQRYWTVRQAADHWGVHYTTAKRLIERHGEALGAEHVRVVRPHGDGVKLVILAGSLRPSADPVGNPQFRDPDMQRQRAQERWDRDKREAEVIREMVDDVTTLSACRAEINFRRSTPGSKVDFDALIDRIEQAERNIGQRCTRREAEAIKAQIKGGG
ncbi:MAG: hypothetical protein IJD99_08725 [Clostridia bacterium]|nr:hypothetical protein [Clostridia bacterium]